MFDIGWSELLVVGIVALVVIGPKELPGVIRGIGQMLTKVRRMAADFQGQFNEALREAELADLKKSVDEVREGVSGLRSMTNPLSYVENEIRDSIEKATTLPDPAQPAPSALAGPPPAATEPVGPPAAPPSVEPAIALPVPPPAPPVDLSAFASPAPEPAPPSPAAEPAGARPA